MTAVLDQRRAWRDSARQYRRKDYELAARGRTFCPKRYCGGRLEDLVDRNGRATLVCPTCVRRERGICRDCPAPVEGVVGRAHRCRPCRLRRLCKASLRWQEQNPEKVQARSRLYAARPEVKARHRERGRAWRAANPLKVALQKRRERLKGRHGNKSREEHLAYHREYNRKRAAKKRAYEHSRTKWFGLAPTCETCSAEVPWTGRGCPRRHCTTCRPGRVH